MAVRTREEHLEWCKKRALEYLDAGDVRNAICSMMSDMSQHEETKNSNQVMMAYGLIVAVGEDEAEARRWIVGWR
jgi:hypothetical protein